MEHSNARTVYDQTIPLSFAQQRMWFTYRLEGRSPIYNMPFALRLEGAVDASALRAAFGDLVARHESLRTVIGDDGAGGEQRVLPEASVEVVFETRDVEEEGLHDVLVAESSYAFDLERDLPIRATLYRLADTTHVLLVVLHHIACDGWSLAPLTRDLFEAYRARCEGHAPAFAPLPVQYADYALWQRETLGDESDPESLSAHLADYWRRQLADLPERMNLPADRAHPAVSSHRGDAVFFTIDNRLYRGIHALARSHQATPFIVLHAAVAALLHGHGAGDDIVVGSPIAGRTDDSLHELVGFFVNNLVLRTDLSGNPSFETVLQRVRDTDLAAFEHQEMPFERLVEILNPTRSLSHQPLFQTTIVVQNNAGAETDGMPGLSMRPESLSMINAKNDLYFTFLEQIEDGESVFYASIDYACDLFDHGTVEALAERFQRLLATVLADPACRLHDIAIVSDEERRRLTVEWNDTDRPLPEGDFVALFERWVAETPEAEAVAFGERTLTYAELDAQANRLAHYLQELGVGPESLVALCVERSECFPIGMLGILKAGAAYLPVDPDYPAERIAWMLNDAMTPVIVSESRVLDRLPSHWAQLVELDTEADTIAEYPDTAPERDTAIDRLAYAIYTSGSTGTPKGVGVSHRGIGSLAISQIERFSVRPGSRVLQFASPSFDAAFWECCMALLSGSCLVLAHADALVPGDALLDTLRRHRVTHATLPPAALPVMMPDHLPDCAQLIVAGDSCAPALVDRWSFGRRMFNAYGPTETTVCATIGDPLHGAVAPPIGRPIVNARVYVLDAALRPAPVGVVGELYLAGRGLARGYLNRPALTSERFVADPFVPGERMYRSGDLARWRVDGQLDFLGRVDHQVKVRGYRIELGEIDAALARLPGVAQSTVLARSDASGEKQIVGYVVAHAAAALEPNALRHALAASLPEYMIPTAIVMLHEMPLTSNGKIDRKALPAPEFHRLDSRVPRTPQETALAALFAEVLGLDSVGIDDSFFDLGGHSLLGTRLVGRIRSTMGVDLAIRTLFEHPTVAALVQQLGSAGEARPQLRPAVRPERLPLSYAQQRLWFIHQLEGSNGTYNIPFALRLEGPVDVDALRTALHDLVIRHESLRTVFAEIDGVAVQRILPPESAQPELTVEPVDASALADTLSRLAAGTFDLERALPIRGHLLALSADTHVLLLLTHHIASDGWSLAPLLGDLGEAYASRAAGRSPGMPPLSVQYADYALWQRELLGDELDPDSRFNQQADYWKRTLAGIPEQINLPVDHPRPAVASYRGDAVSFEIDATVHRRLVDIGRERNATLFMTLHAAFALLLGKLGAGDDIVVGTPIAGRTDDATEHLVGFFVNTLVLRTDLSGQPDFLALLDRVRDTDLAAYAHQDLPFDRLVELLNPVRSLSHQPLFQVMFDLQNGSDASLTLPGLQLRHEPIGTSVAKCDLNLVFFERRTRSGEPDGLMASFEFATELFDPRTIEGFAARMTRVLEAVAAQPDAVIAGIDLLDAEERERQLLRWNDTARAFAADPLPVLFSRQVSRTPHALALSRGDASLSYAELDARVERLARRLAAEGAGPERLVAIALPRSFDAIVAVLATLRAGAAYLPLDLAYPADRLAFMLEDAEPVMVLSDRTDHPFLHARDRVLIATHDAAEDASPAADGAARSWPTPDPRHPAYVIYTSGSTGRPKGVVISHANLADFVGWAVDHFGDRLQRMWLSTSLCFDVSVFELFSPLCMGGGVRIVDDLLALAQEPVEAFTRSLISTVPSALAALIDQGVSLHGVRDLVLAGEAFMPALAERIARDWPACRIANLYGPTESTVYVTGWDGDTDVASSNIGRPLANAQVYVLDSGLRPVPVGVAGELYLAGRGLARGYLRRPSLTAERFVASPFACGERLYRTGDLVRWTADGQLDFLGRVDHQVKVRGFRIELGEIETAIARQPGVARSVVVARPDHAGHLQIVGYAVAGDGMTLDPQAMRRALGADLPEYMVPAAILVLPTLPTTPNGKLDRKALPAPDFASAHRRAPRTPQESTLVALFADVLGLAEVGIDDNFFDIGGHSLLATRLVSRIRATLGVELAIRTLFEHPTVAGLAERIGGDGARRPALRPQPRDGALPLSFAQQRLWFVQQLEGPSGAYNIPLALKLQGALDVDALQAALQDLVARHESLRTLIDVAADDETPCQRIVPAAQAPVILDRAHDAGWHDPVALAAAIDAAAACGFDLARELPIRAHLLQIADHEHVLVLVLHHIAGDGWSLAPLLRDLAQAYAARCEGGAPDWAPLPVQYADYARWQRELLGDEAADDSLLSRQKAYWLRTLDGIPDRIDLPTDRPRPPVATHAGDAIYFDIDAELHAGLLALARERNATLFMVLHAAFAVLLHKLGAGDDVVIGTPIAGRTDDALDDLVGFFVNTLVLRADLSGNPDMGTLIDRVRAADLAAYAHQDLPYERLVDLLNPARSLSHQPLFQVMLMLQNTGDARIALADLDVQPMPVGKTMSKFDLRMALGEQHDAAGAPAGIAAELEFSRDLFDAHSVRTLASRYVDVLERMVAAPAAPVSALCLLDADEREDLQRTWNETARAWPAATLPALFEAQVARTPDAPALLHGDRTLSYAELNRQANAIAHGLIRAGIGSEDIVALSLPRSPALVAALLGILKAGAVYLPIDPEYPPARIADTLADAAPVAAIVDAESRARLLAQVSALDASTLWTVDALAGADAGNPDDDVRVRPLDAGNAAYVLYTSGSTGKPKGVCIQHRSAAAYLRFLARNYGIGEGDIALNLTSISFDPSIRDLLCPLIGGGAVAIVDRDSARDPAAALRAMQAHGATCVLSVTPSLLHEIVQTQEQLALPLRLRQVHTCGEALPGDLLQRALSALGCEVLANQYGPTETTMTSTWKAFRAGEHRGGPVPVGRPVDNARLYVLDAGLQPVAPGVPGELYIGGYGLARGYLGRPALTAERFVADPFVPGQRMYRTGDRVRRLADGDLDFLGRVDHQVKIRGVRVEPGETEAALVRLTGVARAAVIAREDEAGDKRLVAYAVADAGATLDAGALRQALAAVLPDALVPAAVVVLEALPLTPNGKLDRSALPAPAFSRAHARPPRTPQETVLAGLFAGVLGLPEVGIDDSFFELGGHSLLATRLVGRIRATLGVELAIRSLFEHPTVAALARSLDGAERARAPLTARPRPALPPLSHAQQRLWYIQQLEGPSGTYNLPLALRLRGPLQHDALRLALHDLMARHESLRTCFIEVEGVARQRILDAESVVAALDVHALDDVATAGVALEDLLATLSVRGFDLANELPLRAHLIRIAQEDHVLLLVLHHIAGDGWSMGPLLHDFGDAYAARCAGNAPAWAPLPVQYADYALWQRELLGDERDPDSVIARQGAWWRDTLAGLPEQIALPTDRPRPAVASYRGDVVAFAIEPSLHQRLADLSREENATLFMVLHAAFALLLGKAGAGDDIAIGTPIAGRTDDALDGLIGFFVNTLVLRTDLTGNPDFRTLLRRVRAVDLAAYAHQDLPFERLVELLNPVRSLSHQPLFQVMLVLQNNALGRPALQALDVGTETLRKSVAKFDLRLSLAEQWADDGTPAGIPAELEYSEDLFDRSGAERIAKWFVRLLDAVTQSPGRAIASLALLDDDERARMLHDWNATSAQIPAQALPVLFEAQATRTPDAVALRCGDASIDYATLNLRANRLAHRLIAHGIGAEDIVAIALPRSIELVVALLATMKAGAAYLPLDLDYPEARLAYMLQDAAPACVLGHAGMGLAVPDGIPVWTLDTPSHDTQRGREDDPDDATRVRPLRLEHPAYVIYTSGSTGRPKGVSVRHAGVANFLHSMRAEPGLDAGDTLLACTPISFDIAVLELYLPLLCGGCAHIVPREIGTDGLQLRALIEQTRPQAMQATPATWQMLREAGWRPDAGLRVLCGGEALPPDLARYLRQAGALWNMYGPTETTVWSLCTQVGEGPVRVGRAIANTRVYVLDAGLQPVPVGVAGELYLAGEGLARGYFRRPGLTAERFVADPFVSGARMYRTGDLARWLPDGQIDFLGRVDHQVKIRGLRIELGEIEARMAERPGVATACAVARSDDGLTRIVGYVVPAAGADIDPARLRDALSATLPDYMVPAAILVLDALPLSPAGKLDRKALPTPSFAVRDGRRPATPRELLLAELFADVLGVRDVGADDSFFDLGGDSIRSIQLINLARKAGLGLTPRDVLQEKTVAALAQAAKSVLRDDDDGSGHFPPTPIMRDLFARGGRAARNFQHFMVHAPANLTADALARIVQALLDGHGALRMRVPPAEAHDADVEVLPPGAIVAAQAIRHCDIRGMDALQRGALHQQALHMAQTRLDPQQASQLQVVWFDDGGAGEDRVLFCFHHMVMDPVSWRVIEAELADLHASALAGADPVLDTGTSYRRWSQHLHAAAVGEDVRAELPYWQSVLATPDPLLGHRPLRRRPDDGDTAYRHLDLALPASATAALLAAARRNATSVNDLLVAAFAATIAGWRGERGDGGFAEVRFDMEGHGREYGSGFDLTRTVGWFTSLYPTRISLEAIGDGLEHASAGDALLRSVREQLGAIPRKGWAYPLLRQIDPVSSRLLAAHEDSQIIFNYLGRAQVGDRRDWALAPEGAALGARDASLALPYTLQTMAMLHDDDDETVLTARFVAAAELIDEDDLQRLGGIWTRTLMQLAGETDAAAAARQATQAFPRDTPAAEAARSGGQRLASPLAID
ncbi:hypothetical protein GCM10023307_30240 [Lysobacter hankyongensis]|uniref:Carrier domain-containing protein n=2 Tax=Lysobacter hankyongensis TaxID=1176535 RepID=A0ABP9BXJ4_9GAMM